MFIHQLAGRLACLALTALAVSAPRADTYEGYSSTIEGVGLWRLAPSDNAVKRLSFGDNPEFADYCDGKNQLFIYEMSSHGFPCKTEKWLERQGSDDDPQWKTRDLSDKRKLLQTIALAKKDRQSNAGESQYDVSLKDLLIASAGIFTVSKQKLIRGNWRQVVPSADDLRHSVSIASAHMKEIRRNKDYAYKAVLGYTDDQIRELAGNQGADWVKDEKYTIKVQLNNLEIILLPMLYEATQPGGDLISSVVVRDQNGYRFVGHIYGCLHAVGADIDSDGIPEVILYNCDSGGLYQSIGYMKLYPKIQRLISFSNS